MIRITELTKRFGPLHVLRGLDLEIAAGRVTAILGPNGAGKTTLMSGIPLHPLVVHFPIVLVTLLPISVGIALWMIRKGTTPRRVWAVPVALAAALALSA